MKPLHDRPNALRQFEADGAPRREARYFSGWWITECVGGNARSIGARRIEAYLRSESSDWFDLWTFDNWWQAQAFAIGKTFEIDGCVYEGGPKSG